MESLAFPHDEGAHFKSPGAGEGLKKERSKKKRKKKEREERKKMKQFTLLSLSINRTRIERSGFSEPTGVMQKRHVAVLVWLYGIGLAIKLL